MKILKVNNGVSKFLIESEEVTPNDLDRNNLFKLLNKIYMLTDQDSLEIPSHEELDEIKNPVEREIVNLIINKIKDFSENVEVIKNEINSSFPEV